jgi:hypothetical protein
MRKSKTLGLIILLAIFVFLANCSHHETEKKSPQSSQNDTSFLADENFVYKNLANTNNVRIVYKSINGKGLDLTNIYTDSTFRRTYTQLSENQRSLLIAPFLPKGYGVKYARENMLAWFISKQNQTNGYQPIILFELGKADYESLMLILLDKNHQPVSEFDLDENNPTDNEFGCPHKDKSYSYLDNNKITSYRITENTYSAKKQMVFDSNVFRSLVAKNGVILTKQMGKVHVVKFIK